MKFILFILFLAFPSICVAENYEVMLDTTTSRLTITETNDSGEQIIRKRDKSVELNLLKSEEADYQARLAVVQSKIAKIESAQ